MLLRGGVIRKRTNMGVGPPVRNCMRVDRSDMFNLNCSIAGNGPTDKLGRRRQE